MANGIPLRPGLIPSYAQRLGLLAQPGVTIGDITGRGVQPGLPALSGAVAAPLMRGPITRGSQPPPYLRRPAPLPPMPLAAGAMRQAQRTPAAPMAPASQPGFFERIAGIDPTSAAGQALGAAAATGLQMSGYQPRPISTAEGLGAMMAAGQKAFTSAREREQEAELARQKRATDLQLKLMEIQAAGAKTERELRTAQFGQEKDLRKEFVAQSKEFTDALLGFEKVQKAALSKEPTGASDIALVFGYMKVLDPNSVVREGEFATAANAGGVGERVRNLYNQVVEGKLLTPRVRKDFIRSAREQFTPYLQGQTAREQSFTGLSESYGLDPQKVIQTRLPKMGSLARPFVIASEAEAENLPKGSFVFINGRLAEID